MFVSLNKVLYALAVEANELQEMEHIQIDAACSK